MPSGTTLERYLGDTLESVASTSSGSSVGGSMRPSGTQEHLFAEAALALEAYGNHPVALDGILGAALRHLRLHRGLLIGLHGDAWRVLASRDGGLPTGSRITDQDTMQAIDDVAGLPRIHRRLHSAPRTNQDQAGGFDIFIPLRFDRRSIGLLILMSTSDASPPDLAQLASVRTLGVMLAAAMLASMEHHPSARSNSADPRKLLTPRERQVFALLPRGLTNAAIVKRLNIAPGTVKSHVERILHKLGFSDRTQAAVHAARCGMD